MAPPVENKASTAKKPRAPSVLNFSRTFSDRSSTLVGSASGRPSYAEPDDFSSSSPKKSQRSTAYTTPLTFVNEVEAVKRTKSATGSQQLTKENLRSLQAAHEAEDPSAASSTDFGVNLDSPSFLAFMRKSKAKSTEKKKKPDKKRSDHNEHPLNLPPEELRRLSARMARDEKRSSAQMDVDVKDVEVESSTSQGSSEEAQPDNGTNSQPPTPGTDKTPGAFPSDQSNGDAREDTKSPPPPPHRINTQPKLDPEAAKAAGNKFFKAKDYGRAVVEYGKGMALSGRVIFGD